MNQGLFEEQHILEDEVSFLCSMQEKGYDVMPLIKMIDIEELTDLDALEIEKDNFITNEQWKKEV